MYPWRNWNEWSEVFDMLFFNEIYQKRMNEDADGILQKDSEKLKMSLQRIQNWTFKNAGADQLKQLKMQRLLLVQLLSMRRMKDSQDKDLKNNYIESDDRSQALVFRLI